MKISVERGNKETYTAGILKFSSITYSINLQLFFFVLFLFQGIGCQGFYPESRNLAACTERAAFPKILGGSTGDTVIFQLDYNSQVGKMAAVGYT